VTCSRSAIASSIRGLGGAPPVEMMPDHAPLSQSPPGAHVACDVTIRQVVAIFVHGRCENTPRMLEGFAQEAAR